METWLLTQFILNAWTELQNLYLGINACEICCFRKREWAWQFFFCWKPGQNLQQRQLWYCWLAGWHPSESISSSSVLRCWISTTPLTTSCQSPTRVSSCWSCPDTRANRSWKRSWNTPSTSASPSTLTTTPASPSLGSPLPMTAAKTPTMRMPTPLPPTPPKTT